MSNFPNFASFMPDFKKNIPNANGCVKMCSGSSPSPLKAVEVPLSPDSSVPWGSNTVALIVTKDKDQHGHQVYHTNTGILNKNINTQTQKVHFKLAFP